MNQPGIELGGQSSVAVTGVPYFQPPTVITAGNTTIEKSCPLVGFGIFLLILSIASVGLSAWLISVSNFALFADVSLGCAITFLILSLLSTYGGGDVKNRQYSIVWCLVLGILGLIVAVGSIIANLVALMAYGDQCDVCKVDLKVTMTEVKVGARCSAMCSIAYIPAHLTLVILAGLAGVTGLILSISACCNACSCCCCYKSSTPQGYVLQSPVSNTHYFVTPNPNHVPYRPLEPTHDIPPC